MFSSWNNSDALTADDDDDDEAAGDDDDYDDDDGDDDDVSFKNFASELKLLFIGTN